MKVEYLRTAKKSHMIVKEADYPFEQYALKMIQNNRIPCLLQFQVIIEDGQVEYWYDVTGMQSLEKQYSLEAVGKKQLCLLLENLIGMKSVMEEYLLDDADIYFSTGMIYFDRFSKQLRFCYIPGLREERAQGIKELFEEILQKLDHSEPAAVRIGYEMYERCAQSDFVISDCVECLQAAREENVPVGQGIAGAMKHSVQEEADAERSGYGKKSNGLLSADRSEPEFPAEETPQERGHRRKERRGKKKIRYREILEEEREILYAAENIGGSGQTEVFSEQNLVKTWELAYRGDGMEKDICLTDFPFWIGTDSQKVNGVLQSRTVSRIHARLSLQEDKLFVEDYNSTNGTYLNRKLVPMNTPTEVREGDSLVFATEEFSVLCRRSVGMD
ncbi:MAG: FHA domain-containing protein [Clostridiales bacterium]|nr:FHA domain-containing protein [Clostridiales bacterium]